MFLLGFAPTLKGQKERGDLLLGAFLGEYFHVNVFGVMRGCASFLRLMADLLVAAINSGIKFGETDAERLGDLFMALDRSDHSAGLDAGKRGLSDAGLLGDLD